MPFTVKSLSIPDVKLITPSVFSDARGFFKETYKSTDFLEMGLPAEFLQDSVSCSNAGVLRGLHYQLPPFAQGKLVSIICGRIFDVAVDLRRDSPTFGQWVGAELSTDTHSMLWIPEGFAHGFVVLEDHTYFSYKFTQVYNPQAERSILWNDPEIGIEWPVIKDLTLSPKDQMAPLLESAELSEAPL